jgi:hypothetical protein
VAWAHAKAAVVPGDAPSAIEITSVSGASAITAPVRLPTGAVHALAIRQEVSRAAVRGAV